MTRLLQLKRFLPRMIRLMRVTVLATQGHGMINWHSFLIPPMPSGVGGMLLLTD